jgi:hypothetical protein
MWMLGCPGGADTGPYRILDYSNTVLIPMSSTNYPELIAPSPASELAAVFMDDAPVDVGTEPKPTVAAIVTACGNDPAHVNVVRLNLRDDANGAPVQLTDVIDRTAGAGPTIYLRCFDKEGALFPGIAKATRPPASDPASPVHDFEDPSHEAQNPPLEMEPGTVVEAPQEESAPASEADEAGIGLLGGILIVIIVLVVLGVLSFHWR